MANAQPSICIVGAGAAGLAAAWYLAKAGYTDVTVYEKATRVGGKCWSVPIPPKNKHIDMGAVEITPAYPHVLEIAQEVGAQMQLEPPRGTADLSTGTIVWNVDAVYQNYTKEEVGVAALGYLLYVSPIGLYGAYTSAPGMAGPYDENGTPAGVPAELEVPMVTWLKNAGLEPLSGLFTYAATIYGYGDMTKTPAAYMLRYMEYHNFSMILMNAIGDMFGHKSQWPKNFTCGYEDVWNKVAQKLGNVQTGIEIDHIDRGTPVTVHFKGGAAPKTYDRLIVTCCLDGTLSSVIGDLTPQEKALFDATVYSDYYTTAVQVTSFPNNATSGSFGEVPLPKKGHPWGVFKVWPDVDAAVYYSMGVPGSVGGPEIYKLIQQDAAALGYSVGPILQAGGVTLQKRWDYFPHVESGLNAHYLALEALQGEKNTYYSGGLLCFETVHNCTTYSKSLIERNFPPVT